jgi:hypothetical protein
VVILVDAHFEVRECHMVVLVVTTDYVGAGLAFPAAVRVHRSAAEEQGGCLRKS